VAGHPNKQPDHFRNTRMSVPVIKAIGPRATPAQIAKALGRCEADVRAIMFPEREEPAPPLAAPNPAALRSWTDTDMSILRLMYCEAGATADACAHALNRTPAATKTQIRKQGLQRTPRSVAA